MIANKLKPQLNYIVTIFKQIEIGINTYKK